MQGGPLMHVIAAKAVAFQEALEPEFKDYQQQVRRRTRGRWRRRCIERGYKIVSGGTDNHLFLVDLSAKTITGKDADAALGKRAHHGEQERGAERSAPAVRHQRPSHRHAGGDHARLQGSRVRRSWRTGSATCSMRRATTRSSLACATKVTLQCKQFPVYGD